MSGCLTISVIACYRMKVPVARGRYKEVCGNSSVVEHHLAKVGVAGSTPVSRSIVFRELRMRRHSQVVRQRSAKPLFPGSNPGAASNALATRSRYSS